MNNITIALDVEDRIRFDKLNTNLTILNAAMSAVISRLEGLTAAEEVIHVPGQVSIDEEATQEPSGSHEVCWDTRDLHQEPAEAPEPVEEVQPLPITVTVLDEPQEAETEAPVPNVTKADILAKVIELCGKGKKPEAKDVITTYADSVSDLPDSALIEVWDKLVALEG